MRVSAVITLSGVRLIKATDEERAGAATAVGSRSTWKLEEINKI